MIKKLSFYTFLMLLVPAVTLAIGWKWSIAMEYPQFGLDYWLFLLTETGSTPYALITCVVFMLWLMWLTKKRYSWFLVGFICATSVVGTQVIKEGTKAVFKEPRPFVTELFKAESTAFYALPKEQQAQAVLTYPNNNDGFVAAHQADELGYSFPSGHTIFAVSWLLIFAGFLFGLKGQAVAFAQIFAICWAALMLVSRLRLGMHYPVDLLASTLIAWVFHLVLFLWFVPLLERLNPFKLFVKKA